MSPLPSFGPLRAVPRIPKQRQQTREMGPPDCKCLVFISATLGGLAIKSISLAMGISSLPVCLVMYILTSQLFPHRTRVFADGCLDNQPKRRFRAHLGQDARVRSRRHQ